MTREEREEQIAAEIVELSTKVLALFNSNEVPTYIGLCTLALMFMFELDGRKLRTKPYVIGGLQDKLQKAIGAIIDAKIEQEIAQGANYDQ